MFAKILKTQNLIIDKNFMLSIYINYKVTSLYFQIFAESSNHVIDKNNPKIATS